MTVIKNAIIKTAWFERECGLSAWLSLDYADGSQCFGGFVLYSPAKWQTSMVGANVAGHFIWRCLEIANVTDWSKLPGVAIRVIIDGEAIVAIGHIIKDDFFNPTQDFKIIREHNP